MDSQDEVDSLREELEREKRHEELKQKVAELAKVRKELAEKDKRN